MQVEGHKSSLEPGKRWADFLRKAASGLGSLLLASAAICWIAANWQHASGLQKLAVAQLGLIALILLTWRLVYVHGRQNDQNWSAASLLCAAAAVGTGGLLALIGQIYHTHADAWQLFFWWAWLLVPWLLGMRSILIGLLGVVLFNVAGALYLDRWTSGSWLPTSVVLVLLNAAMLALWEYACGWFNDRWRVGPRVLGGTAVAWLIVATLAAIGTDTGALAVSIPGLMAAALMLRLYSSERRRDAAMITLAVLAAFFLLAIPVVAAVESEASLLAAIFGLLVLSVLCVQGLRRMALRSKSAAAEAASTDHPAPAAEAWHVVLFRLAVLGLSTGLVIAFVTMVLDMDVGDSWHIGLPMSAAGILVMRGTRRLLLAELGVTLVAAGLLLTGVGIYSLDAWSPMIRAFGMLALGVLLYILADNAALRWLIAFFVLALASLLTWPEHARYELLNVSGGNRVWLYLPAYFRLWWLAVAAIVALVVGGRRRAAAFWAPMAWALTILAQAMAWLAPAPGLGRFYDVWLQAPELIVIWFACALLPPVALWALLWRMQGPRRALRFAAPFALAVASAGWMGAPGVALAVLWLILGHALRRKSLMVFGVFSILAYLGRFYYQLDSSLLEKAMILGATGLWLVGAALLLRNNALAGAAATAPETAPEHAAAAAVPGGRWQAAGLMGGLILVLAVANLRIYQYEDILRSGRAVLLELAPVDPRSLMQGDYMALRFAIADQAAEKLLAGPPSPLPQELERRGGGYLMLRPDSAGVYRLQEVVADSGKPAMSATALEGRPPSGDIALAFRWRNGRADVATDAWYFPEGQARRYEQARYGELRVGADGTGLLLRLLDNNRRPLP